MSFAFGLPDAFAFIALIVWVEIDRRIDKRAKEIREDIAALRQEMEKSPSPRE